MDQFSQINLFSSTPSKWIERENGEPIRSWVDRYTLMSGAAPELNLMLDTDFPFPVVCLGRSRYCIIDIDRFCEIVCWCREFTGFENYYTQNRTHFFFSDEAMAVAFKLRWFDAD